MVLGNFFGRLAILGGLSFFVNVQAADFGALAIDKSNGSAYGWAYGQPSLDTAEKRAQQECSQRSGKRCTVVLAWSGEGCGAYRTVDNQAGTAYGWGVAKTQGEADAIATREALKRSKGVAAPNFVWACNATDKNKLKVIKNDAAADIKTVKIGSQVWMAESLSTGEFRNGDAIPYTQNSSEWAAARKAGKPISRSLKDKPANDKKYGRFYTLHAAYDKRGICPAGFHLPSKQEWETLIKTAGETPKQAAAKLKSKREWAKKAGVGTDQYGFNALPAGTMNHSESFDGVGEYADFWTSTPAEDNYVWVAMFRGWGQDIALDKVAEDAAKGGVSIRCIQD